jgi:membrane protease YdiL (CAAX protease family)
MINKQVRIFIFGAVLYLSLVQLLYSLENSNRILVALFGYVVAAIFMKFISLSLKDIGLPNTFVAKTAFVSAGIVIAVFVVTAVAYVILPSAFLDSRYNQTVGALLRAILLYLPFSVVVFEEVLFRGVVLGYLLKVATRKIAIACSSLLFGLWHIPSAQDFSLSVGLPQVVITIGIVLFTALAGWAFSELRLRSGSLLAPIALHWSVNAAGMIFAYIAWQG